jgi:hypothetical protein
MDYQTGLRGPRHLQQREEDVEKACTCSVVFVIDSFVYCTSFICFMQIMGKGRKFKNKEKNFAQKRRAKEVC